MTTSQLASIGSGILRRVCLIASRCVLQWCCRILLVPWNLKSVRRTFLPAEPHFFHAWQHLEKTNPWFSASSASLPSSLKRKRLIGFNIGSNLKRHFESWKPHRNIDHQRLSVSDNGERSAILHERHIFMVGVISGCYSVTFPPALFSPGTVQVAFLRSHHDGDIALTIPASFMDLGQQMPSDSRDIFFHMEAERWTSQVCFVFPFFLWRWLAFLFQSTSVRNTCQSILPCLDWATGFENTSIPIHSHNIALEYR